jgi:hypothetical protein
MANIFQFVAAAVLGFDFIRGLRRGSATLFFSDYQRSEKPLAYWAAIGLSGIGSVTLLVLLAL